jgi:hypothetical protein
MKFFHSTVFLSLVLFFFFIFLTRVELLHHFKNNIKYVNGRKKTVVEIQYNKIFAYKMESNGR